MVAVLCKVFIVFHQKQVYCYCFVSEVMIVFVNNPTQLCSEENMKRGGKRGQDVAGSQQSNKEGT